MAEMKQLSWVEAIRKVMEDSNGVATLQILYKNIGKYRDYSHYKRDADWQAALRGHLYREIRNNRNFKRIGLAIYALQDYKEEVKPRKEEKQRMHSFVEGVCLELGNLEKFATYTADPSAVFRDGIPLDHLATLKEVPQFTYPEIINEVKRIDVVWFNMKGLMFPKKVFEVVDSIGTLSDALNRSSQLIAFNVDFFILGPKEHFSKFEQKISLEPYTNFRDKYKFKSYDDIVNYYEKAVVYNVARKGFI